jgi:hypothetical protein
MESAPLVRREAATGLSEQVGLGEDDAVVVTRLPLDRTASVRSVVLESSTS